jgi:16S rRNA (guanine527-N7)-methyltransferase
MREEELLPGFAVSRETFLKLKEYEKLLTKWNSKINLVSKSTLRDFWNRHILDSVQVFCSIGEKTGKWADFGSGGGFPGLVLAILSDEFGVSNSLCLIEADVRKSVFLRTVCRELGLVVDVFNNRIEEISPMLVDVVSARALAPLKTLCFYAESHLNENGIAVFAKGENWESELLEAQKNWIFDYDVVTSKLHQGSVILVLRGIKSV